MARVLVRHLKADRAIDHLEVDDSGAWRRERCEMPRIEAEYGRLSTSDAAALFARIEAILPTVQRTAGGDLDNVIVLSGFRADPAAFTAGAPGFAALDAALAPFPWELPILAPAPAYVTAAWRTGAGCGASVRVRIDALGGVESTQDQGGSAVSRQLNRVRIPPEAAAALLADLRSRWPDANPPRQFKVRISTRWLTARFEGDPEPTEKDEIIFWSMNGASRRVDDDSPAFAPLHERIRAALGESAPWVEFAEFSGPPAEPPWKPVPHRISWRMTDAASRGSDSVVPTVEGELGLDGRILQWSGLDRKSPLPPVPLDPDRVDALFGLAARLFDEETGPSEWTPDHARVPGGVHTLNVELLGSLGGPRTIVHCNHTRPAYAALERALREAIGGRRPN